ncbi:glycosyltransferase family 4 protein [Synechococcus sp. WH 8016]|uniref:glycosyltransferase family 4 protein n=1 Tax=Synechococcus sp. WH 8016 TaxID=166318 RepID=UPI00022D9C7B|nr:glycosyltransferase family 4 protein [Synechococcus sp. WH 8016]EHA62376.1 hypothetical protein Syn8016DRAFT_1671 [Synechococcus sp. WH 8016]
MTPRYLVCCGDATDIATWSSTPYFLLQAGLKQKLLCGGLDLHPKHLKLQRRLWNLKQLLITGKAGGYQYSSGFTKTLLDQALLKPDQSLRLLSHFPLLPCHPWPSAWRVDFYIDATTHQVFDHYGSGKHLAAGYRRQVLERERNAYLQAGSIVCMAQWSADSVINDYCIDPAKVHVVPGGANIDEIRLAKLPLGPPPTAPCVEQPLRLGFLGKEWKRKGGPFLLELADALQQKDIPTVIRAIGPDPSSLPAHPALQPLGFIDKQSDTVRFIAELRSWHFGTLFSEVEAFGISNRECLRLGVPVLAHDVGGINSTLPFSACGQLFKSHPSPVEVAEWIAVKLYNYTNYLAWRAELATHYQEFTWELSVRKLSKIVLN